MYGLGDALDGLVLADDALVNDVVEVQQLLALALHELCDGMPVHLATMFAISSSVTGVVHQGVVRAARSRGGLGLGELLLQRRAGRSI